MVGGAVVVVGTNSVVVDTVSGVGVGEPTKEHKILIILVSSGKGILDKTLVSMQSKSKIS